MVEVSGQSFQSIGEAIRSVLELLEKLLPGSSVFVAQFDEQAGYFRVIDARANGGSYPVESGFSIPLDSSFCFHMAARRAPQLTGDAESDPVYSQLPVRERLDIGSYVAAPLELEDTTRVGSLCAISRQLDAYEEDDLERLAVMARILSFELERENRELDLRRNNEELRDQAISDPLTDLGNRRSFMTALEREWQLTRRGTARSYLVVADIDGLKRVNDEHGHATGDVLLKDVADALASAARGTDIVGRLGGDEFGVLLVGCEGGREAAAYCDRARRVLREKMSERSATVDVSLGFGGLADSSSSDQALHLADRVMYAEKKSRFSRASGP